MLKSLCTLRLRAVLGLLVIVVALQVSVRGQDLVGGASRTDLSGGAGGSGTRNTPIRRPKVRNTATTTAVKTVTRTKTVVVTPTTGTLSVATEPGAAILVEPLRGGDALEAQMEKDERVFVFGNLKPGRYRVAAEFDGYTEAEEEVQVLANKNARVTLDLRPITYSVTIAANVQAGEVRYATVVASRDAAGQIKYNQTGEVRVTPLQNGRATLPNLRVGTYGVDVRAADVGYQTLLATFTLPGESTYNVTLPKLLSTKTFSAAWVSLDAWEAPAGWQVASRKLSVNGRGVALPRDDSVRHFADFHLVSDVNMLNGVAASFAVRAQDSRNYYLIQITGAKSDEQYVLRGFVVRNGVEQRFASAIPIDAFAGTLKQNKFFTVSMEAIGNKFKVFVTDSVTGDVLPLGILEDPNRNFPIGAVGIGVRDTEQNEIVRFIVCTSESADCLRG